MGLKLCGIFSAETPDVENDTFSLSGMSINQLQNGFCNFDHHKEADDFIGRIISAKKIMSEKDCKTPQELRFFNNINRIPFLFGIVELFDDEKHEKAQGIASAVEHFKKRGLDLPYGWSIEAEPVSVTNSKFYTLSIAKRIALTHKPVLKCCTAEIYEEPFDMNVKQPSVDTSKADIGEADMTKSESDSKIAEVLDKLCNSATEISKALEAGYAMGAPGTNVQGTALQKGTKELQAKKDVQKLATHYPVSQEETTTESSAEHKTVAQKIDENEQVKTKDSTPEAIKKEQDVAMNLQEIKSIIRSFLTNSKIAKKI